MQAHHRAAIHFCQKFIASRSVPLSGTCRLPALKVLITQGVFAGATAYARDKGWQQAVTKYRV